MFTISDRYSQDLKSFREFASFYMNHNEYTQAGEFIVSDNMIPKLCNSSEFPVKFQYSIEQKLRSMPGFDFHCLNLPGTYFSNPILRANSSFITFFLNINCNETNDECPESYYKNREHIYLGIHTPKVFLNPKNYSHPLTYDLETLTIHTHYQMTNTHYYSFTYDSLVTDQGWMLEDEQDESYVSLQSIKKDVSPVLDGVLYRMLLVGSDTGIKTYRRYTKIQEVMATIGGIFKFLTVVLYVITSPYISFKYYSYHYALLYSQQEVHEHNNNSNKPQHTLLKDSINRDNELNQASKYCKNKGQGPEIGGLSCISISNNLSVAPLKLLENSSQSAPMTVKKNNQANKKSCSNFNLHDNKREELKKAPELSELQHIGMASDAVSELHSKKVLSVPHSGPSNLLKDSKNTDDYVDPGKGGFFSYVFACNSEKSEEIRRIKEALSFAKNLSLNKRLKTLLL
eukprot:CAMPEP_0170520462 /NCGR_PEP_ID=MMETSP0209-20121228/5741_1 /TAXON_ID=665100 ORGANISM="Litonotus pictus, Strain P1" /NCGR_SAMPLE_ID=MMETSP0209 /ASSEMBLY_ACC=CAM_ASM_000301 /LENGTH=456 /DNA_ID=CAMNT_0010806753 /DNA_START=233 /DNA_END=1603 /DNA_ORIENTATION=-